MGNNISIFTCPRSFEGKIGIIQTNAVKSWERIKKLKAEIIFVSDDPGVAEQARKMGCIHVPGVERNQWGTPMVRDVFAKGQKAASQRIVGYANSDIVFTEGVYEAITRVVAFTAKQFLIVGQRWDFYYPKPIDFSPGWKQRFAAEARKNGSLHGPTAIDYLFFRRGLYDKIPAFALGRRAWDNWLVWYALRQGIPVWDATDVLTAIHIGKATTKPVTPEIEHNRRLAHKAGTWGRVNYATVKLQPIYGYPGELYVKEAK